MNILKKHSKTLIKEDEIPDGYHTIEYWANDSKITPGHARKLIYDLINEGLWESAKFKIRKESGLRYLTHYRPKPNADLP